MATVTDASINKGTSEKFEFQTETKKLLNLMISSIYSNKEIFLRELISNSSDALDKLKFEALTKTDLLPKDKLLEIFIRSNKKEHTLSIEDNGIGMTKDEVIKNIGTIAKSGTEELVKKMQKQEGNEQMLTEMIGQFGVGFYSVFMVADKVEMLTKKAGRNQAVKWTSRGDNKYTIEEHEKQEPGTLITLYLKKMDQKLGIEDFTDQYVLEGIIKKYSDFIHYPIKLEYETEEPEKDKDGKPIKDGKSKTVIENKVVNSMKPIWSRPVKEVKKEEYNEFYKHIAHDWQEPLENILYHAEGRIEYTALLFLPSRAPFDLFYQSYESGLQLYVRKILIVDHFEELLPKYLRFVKGVVDSPSLPLNISREMLQKDIHIGIIKKGLTNKILSTLKKMFEKERDRYILFWKEFGPALKEGLSFDFENKEKLTEILLFYSSFSKEKLTSLKEYCDRMPQNQKNIYYVAGDTREIAENSPHIEIFKSKGFEILYLLDPIDQMVGQYIGEYDKKKFLPVETAHTDLFDEKDKEKKEKDLKEKQEKMSDFLKQIQNKLDKDIKEVRLTDRLILAPACIVSDGMGLSPQLEKLFRQSGQQVPESKKILELNGSHPIVTKLYTRFQNDKEDTMIEEYSELLLGYSVITEGGEIVNTGKFGKLFSKVLENAI